MRTVKNVVLAVIVVFILILTLSFITSPGTSPVTVTSPVSDSMEPTIGQDEFLLVVGSEPDVGDVILFDDENHKSSVLHRVDSVTDDGKYITKGDANKRTDQADSDMDPVPPDAVYGTVPEITDGTHVSIPFVGAILTNPSVVLAFWILVTIIGLGPAIFSATNKGVDRSSHREQVRDDRRIVIIVAVVIMLILPVAVMGSEVTETASIVTSQSVTIEEQTERTVAINESVTQTVDMQGETLAGMRQTVHVEGNLTVSNVSSAAWSSATTLDLSNEPRDEPGADIAEITMYTYPATLPYSVQQYLASVHPVLAGIASGAVISAALIIAALIFIRARKSKPQDREAGPGNEH